MAQEMNRRWTDRIPRPLRDWLLLLIMFGMLAVLNVTVGIAARDAKNEAAEVRKTLEEVNVTAQNRCIIRVILSFPPPVDEEQFDRVLGDYDECIEKETAAVKKPGE